MEEKTHVSTANPLNLLVLQRLKSFFKKWHDEEHAKTVVPVLGFKRLRDNSLPLPEYKTEGAAGMDVYADLSQMEPNGFGLKQVYVRPELPVLIKTGLSLVIPKGYEVQVRSRSGLALNHGVVVLNSPGTVDWDYTGELGIILGVVMKDGQFCVNHGDRIAQLVIAPVTRCATQEVTEVPQTERGSSGFGSTGA